MRSVIVALGIIVLCVAGSLLYTTHLEATANEMLKTNNSITASVVNEEYERAVVEIKSLTSYVREKRVLLDAIGNHQELDDIEEKLSELLAYAYEKDKMHSLSKCYMLDFLIKSLPRNFKLKIENIL